MKKAIIIGATSGIGRELALQLIEKNYQVGLTGRRLDKLNELKNQYPNNIEIAQMDISQTSEARTILDKLIQKLKDVELIVISSGTGFLNPELDWEKENQTIEVNVSGFTAIANKAFNYFKSRGGGHLVGISSIAAERGGPGLTYNASKAYVGNYLEGLYGLSFKEKLNIHITDIRPGFVDTDMAKGEGLFWVAPVKKAAQQIISAIDKKKRLAYITSRWKIVAFLLRILPDFIYKRL